MKRHVLYTNHSSGNKVPLVALAGILVGAIGLCCRQAYSPYKVPSHVEEIDPVPEIIKRPDGLIDPSKMSSYIRDALQECVGSIDSGTPCKHWVNYDPDGQPFDVYGGVWKTSLVKTPNSLLQNIVESNEPPDMENLKLRALYVTYSIERRSGINRPGEFYVGIDVFVSGGENHKVKVEDPTLIRLLSSDFLKLVREER